MTADPRHHHGRASLPRIACLIQSPARRRAGPEHIRAAPRHSSRTHCTARSHTRDLHTRRPAPRPRRSSRHPPQDTTPARSENLRRPPQWHNRRRGRTQPHRPLASTCQCRNRQQPPTPRMRTRRRARTRLHKPTGSDIVSDRHPHAARRASHPGLPGRDRDFPHTRRPGETRLRSPHPPEIPVLSRDRPIPIHSGHNPDMGRCSLAIPCRPIVIHHSVAHPRHIGRGHMHNTIT